jgi:iron(III) transport system substrate-binding protein
MLSIRRKTVGLTFIGVMLLLLSLGACTNQSATQTVRETVVVTQEVPVRETVVVRETVEVPVEEPIVYVYSARHYGQMETAFAEFTKETGIEVRFTFGSDAELRERLKAEGRFTPADVLFTVDAANLWLAAQEGILRPINSDVLESNIPDYLQDPSNQWYALSLRIRTIAYHPDRVNPAEISTYESLADPKWAGRICWRPSTKSYTQSLVSSLIVHHGYDKAKEIVSGWAKNSKEYIDSDTKILEAIAAGGCDVGVVNHYYLARLLDKDANFPVKLLWANQDDRGVHVNASGAGVTTYARHPENAIRLLEWLSTERGQRLFADSNFEYPANPAVTPHELIKSWGEFKRDTVQISEIGSLQADAVKLMNEAGYQ